MDVKGWVDRLMLAREQVWGTFLLGDNQSSSPLSCISSPPSPCRAEQTMGDRCPSSGQREEDAFSCGCYMDHLSHTRLGTFPPCLLLLSGTEVSEDLS